MVIPILLADCLYLPSWLAQFMLERPMWLKKQTNKQTAYSPLTNTSEEGTRSVNGSGKSEFCQQPELARDQILPQSSFRMRLQPQLTA